MQHIVLKDSLLVVVVLAVLTGAVPTDDHVLQRPIVDNTAILSDQVVLPDALNRAAGCHGGPKQDRGVGVHLLILGEIVDGLGAVDERFVELPVRGPQLISRSLHRVLCSRLVICFSQSANGSIGQLLSVGLVILPQNRGGGFGVLTCQLVVLFALCLFTGNGVQTLPLGLRDLASGVHAFREAGVVQLLLMTGPQLAHSLFSRFPHGLRFCGSPLILTTELRCPLPSGVHLLGKTGALDSLGLTQAGLRSLLPGLLLESVLLLLELLIGPLTLCHPGSFHSSLRGPLCGLLRGFCIGSPLLGSLSGSVQLLEGLEHGFGRAAAVFLLHLLEEVLQLLPVVIVLGHVKQEVRFGLIPGSSVINRLYLVAVFYDVLGLSAASVVHILYNNRVISVLESSLRDVVDMDIGVSVPKLRRQGA